MESNWEIESEEKSSVARETVGSMPTTVKRR